MKRTKGIKWQGNHPYSPPWTAEEDEHIQAYGHDANWKPHLSCVVLPRSSYAIKQRLAVLKRREQNELVVMPFTRGSVLDTRQPKDDMLITDQGAQNGLRQADVVLSQVTLLDSVREQIKQTEQRLEKLRKLAALEAEAQALRKGLGL